MIDFLDYSIRLAREELTPPETKELERDGNGKIISFTDWVSTRVFHPDLKTHATASGSFDSEDPDPKPGLVYDDSAFIEIIKDHEHIYQLVIANYCVSSNDLHDLEERLWIHWYQVF